MNLDQIDIVKDLSLQRIYFYPPEGRPTSTPTVAIKDESGSTLVAAASTYVTLDSVSTTVSSASSVGDKTLTLTAVTGIEVADVPVEYLVTNSKGQRERVRVLGCATSTKVVDIDEPLQYAHDTAATFVGTRFYYTVQSAVYGTLAENLRARASYAVGGLNYILEVPFDVVLTPLPNLLTAEFVKIHRPDVMAQEFDETRGRDLAGARTVAWNRIRRAIRSHETGWRPALLRTPSDVEDWAIAELDLHLFEIGIRSKYRELQGVEALTAISNDRNAAKEKALSALRFMDLDEDDSKGADEDRPLRMDFIR